MPKASRESPHFRFKAEGESGGTTKALALGAEDVIVGLSSVGGDVTFGISGMELDVFQIRSPSQSQKKWRKIKNGFLSISKKEC